MSVLRDGLYGIQQQLMSTTNIMGLLIEKCFNDDSTAMASALHLLRDGLINATNDLSEIEAGVVGLEHSVPDFDATDSN